MKKIVNEKSTFEEIYAEFHNPLMNWISFKIKNKSTAEELANDVLIKVFKHLPIYNPEISKFQTWIMNICNNVIIDHYRTVNETKKANLNKSISMIDDSMDYENYPKAFQVPDKKCVIADSLHDTKIIGNNTMKAINMLKGKQKDIAIEYFINELKYDEISTELNLPLSTVKVNIMRIREKLQSKLKEEYQLLY